MELQSRYADITKQGLGLIAISYDSPETLRRFSDSRGISFPLVSDGGSAIIRRYGLLNDTVDSKSRTYGIPHPGTFVVDRKGVVRQIHTGFAGPATGAYHEAQNRELGALVDALLNESA